MRVDNKISEKKQQLLEDFKNTPIVPGEEVYFIPAHISQYSSNNPEKVTVVSVEGDDVFVKRYGYKDNLRLKKENIVERFNKYNVGVNPFVEKYRSIRAISYAMDSIIFNLELVERRREENWVVKGVKAQEVNWNPFVYDSEGKKKYYQRGFVWTLEQKQLLIESIYKGINCGVILVRKRSWKELESLVDKGETELSFTDIVDGKQRLNAIKEFLNDEIPDMHGNYFSDLSDYAQNKFGDHQLFQYAEMENATDEEVLYQFLKMNHEGVPQSKEHLDFVAKLLNEKQNEKL